MFHVYYSKFFIFVFFYVVNNQPGILFAYILILHYNIVLVNVLSEQKIQSDIPLKEKGFLKNIYNVFHVINSKAQFKKNKQKFNLLLYLFNKINFSLRCVCRILLNAELECLNLPIELNETFECKVC